MSYNLSQNLVEVIREQQLAEWVGDGNPLVGTLQDDCKHLIRFTYTRQLFFSHSDPYPVTLKLHTRLCTETYCKPKRPYWSIVTVIIFLVTLISVCMCACVCACEKLLWWHCTMSCAIMVLIGCALYFCTIMWWTCHCNNNKRMRSTKERPRALRGISLSGLKLKLACP